MVKGACMVVKRGVWQRGSMHGRGGACEAKGGMHEERGGMRGMHAPLLRDTAGQCVGGTHPTGMPSCYHC